jgi:MFS family permease
LVYLSAVNIISQWFLAKRGLAFGLAVAGSGLGGLAMAPLAQALISQLSWNWSLRVIGLMIFATCAVGSFVYRKTPPSRRKEIERRASMKSEDFEAMKKANEKVDLRKKKMKIFDFSYFKDIKFLLLYVASGIGIFG